MKKCCFGEYVVVAVEDCRPVTYCRWARNALGADAAKMFLEALGIIGEQSIEQVEELWKPLVEKHRTHVAVEELKLLKEIK